MLTRALILAGGAGPRRSGLDAAWPGWDGQLAMVVAADAGALLAEPLGLSLDLIVGDADSLGEARLAGFARAGVAIERAPADKDESDLELALRAAVGRGATEVVVLGAFGGRLDHLLVNVTLLAMPALAGIPVALLDERSRARLLTAGLPGPEPSRIELVDRPGDLVTLLAFDGPAVGVTTHGLRWPLAGATLPAGSSLGLSNVVTNAVEEASSGWPAEPTLAGVWVELGSGRLLLIETTLLGSEV